MNGPALTREQVRQVDRRAIEELRIPGLTLMERAAAVVTSEAIAMLNPDREGKTVVILCGGGNNGGDGLAAARLLRERGVPVVPICLKSRDDYKGDALTNLERYEESGEQVVFAADEPVETLRNLETVDLIVDAILGTGLTSNVRRREKVVIRWINGRRVPVLAVDIPSGLDCDTGQPLGTAVEADRTVTFVANKVGFREAEAKDYVGELLVSDIGIPSYLIDQVISETAEA